MLFMQFYKILSCLLSFILILLLLLVWVPKI